MASAPGAAPTPTLLPARAGPWLTATALGAAAAVLVPIAGVVGSLAAPAWPVWRHLWETQLAELFRNTLGLLLGVGLGVLGLGTGLAWLTASCTFPGRRCFEWALVLPLALPAYVIGFVFLGIFDFAGPVQSGLRSLAGGPVPFPELRSGWGTTVVMTLVLYPYVYALARTAFLDQAPEPLESARSLGASRTGTFFRVTLPLARPALAAGTTMAVMEALADFGTVSTFGYRTLTEAVYRVWHGMFDRLAATQLAAGLLGLAACLVLLERQARGRARFAHGRRPGRPPAPLRLTGLRAAAATATCGSVLGLAFVLPVGQLLWWVAGVLRRDGVPAGFVRLLLLTLGLAGLTTALVALVAVLLGYALRVRPRPAVVGAVRLATLGYALPGAVIAVGVLLPLAWLDHRLAAVATRLTGWEPGLLLTGSAAALVFAYLVRFLALGFQTVDATLARIPPRLDEMARSLGAGPGRTLRAIHLPLLRRGLLTAAILVFVDVMKEMPATILLRPVGLDTLAVEVWQRTAESLWPEAALPALALVLAGLVPVALIVRSSTPERRSSP